MKLIVLYGPEKSGKTTTLKMVYDVLKKLNICEEKRFNYLDPNMFLDFRDVLIIERPDFSKLLIKENKSKNDDEDFDNNYPSIEDESPIHDEKSPLDNIFPDYIGEEDDENDELDEEDSFDEELDNDNVDDESSNLVDTLPNKKNKTELPNSNDTRKVGIILDGDYGCVNGECVCKKYRNHKRLCNNIQDFQDCDIIICACSQKKLSKIEKPSNCIKWAIRYYHAPFIVERTHKIKKAGTSFPCSYYLRREKRLANRILRDLERIW